MQLNNRGIALFCLLIYHMILLFKLQESRARPSGGQHLPCLRLRVTLVFAAFVRLCARARLRRPT